ncbi:docking protein 2 isoform X2 [Echeneis naucrates]|uniref:docking protein 2 isoform X2 n=1 Tax=Echeneis naucrates TaxID=173247 RepID=UPI00111370C2|nr:docking protein 2-like isoform X2 [Echeneis naucrates]
MEEDIRKQGILFLQQQRFGKKWKKVWCVLYRESSCSISRLEFFECKDGGTDRSDKTLRKQQEHKKVIRLADCIRVSEVDMDGCPKDTGPFLVETTDKMFVFAADRNQVEDWTHKLCEIAFPMNWLECGVKRGSLQRGQKVDEDEGMEDNSLYSGRDTVCDFRVCVRRTEASERCRLKGDLVLRADQHALHLLERTGDLVYTWPYRFLRRFGRDKSTFSFEAGRRCESGEGNFEFDTKQGNFLFQVVEAAINLQKTSTPHRQTSGGGQVSPETLQSFTLPPVPLSTPLGQSRMPPPPQPRSHVPQPPTAQTADCVYSMLTKHPNLQSHHKDKEGSAPSQPQQHSQLSRLEPPVDKVLTGVKSLTLDTRGVPIPRKNQVKMISSCPLPADPGPNQDHNSTQARLSPKLSSEQDLDQAYSQIDLVDTSEPDTFRERRKRKPGVAAPATAPQTSPDPEYSLPFDTINKSVMANILNHEARVYELGADPLYDCIDEMKIRNIFLSDTNDLGPTYRKVEHIYDEPEGCAMAAGGKNTAAPPSLYDDPEEMRGDAWRIMGTASDPKGHEYPYNPRVDDYAVPKRPQRAVPLREEQKEEQRDSPYNNVMVKMA